MKLTPNFHLAEFLPHGLSEAPPEILASLTQLCVEIMQPLREAIGKPIIVHSGWRLPLENEAIGGAKASDHLTGRACDFHVDGSGSWEDNTFDAYHWLRANKLDKIGQLILEDHRHALGKPGKLWVHVALPSPKHPKAEVLMSFFPGSYQPWKDDREGLA